MKLIATEKADQNRTIVDPWSVVHFSAGLALGLMEVSEEVAYSSAVAYEIVEQYMERQEWGQEIFETEVPEVPSNVLFDVVIFGVGYHLGRWWNRT